MSAKAELRRIAFWADALSDAEADRARKGIVEKSFAAGSYICHRGDRLDAWTGVISGLVKLGAISEGGKAMTFAGVGAGGWFGEGTILKNEPRKYDLVALRDTRLGMMNRATFSWLFDHSVGFNKFLVNQLNERMGQFIATIELDRIHDPTPRVARHLAWMLNPVLYPATGRHIEISQEQEEIALLAGVSRASANRSLQMLESSGLLRVEHRGVTVHDVAQLAQFTA